MQLGLILAVIGLPIAAAPALAQDQAGAIIFQIDHVRDDAGHVRVDVCTKSTFLKDGCPYSGQALAVKGVTTVTVPGVPPGIYAAQIYHDRNDNNRVDRSKPLGIPLEEVGFSNNAPIGLRGPRWAKAAFNHDVSDQSLGVKLKRFP